MVERMANSLGCPVLPVEVSACRHFLDGSKDILYGLNSLRVLDNHTIWDERHVCIEGTLGTAVMHIDSVSCANAHTMQVHRALSHGPIFNDRVQYWLRCNRGAYRGWWWVVVGRQIRYAVASAPSATIQVARDQSEVKHFNFSI
jgi:hypothetical protein